MIILKWSDEHFYMVILTSGIGQDLGGSNSFRMLRPALISSPKRWIRAPQQSPVNHFYLTIVDNIGFFSDE